MEAEEETKGRRVPYGFPRASLPRCRDAPDQGKRALRVHNVPRTRPEPGVEVMPDSKADSKVKVAEFCELCAQASFVYNLYRSLFVSDTSRIELYKAIAPYCFVAINTFLLDYVRLQFCKITDPAKTGKNFNLTTNYILQKLD